MSSRERHAEGVLGGRLPRLPYPPRNPIIALVDFAHLPPATNPQYNKGKRP